MKDGMLHIKSGQQYATATQIPTERNAAMNQTKSQSEVPMLFRGTLEVGDLEEAAMFYARLFDTPGPAPPGCASVLSVR